MERVGERLRDREGEITMQMQLFAMAVREFEFLRKEREDEGGFNRLPLPLQVNTHNEIKPS